MVGAFDRAHQEHFEASVGPLTYVSEDSDDLIPLTPAMLLCEVRESSLPEFDEGDSKSLNRRLKYLSRLLDHFRSRFRAEYLSTLVHRFETKGFRGSMKIGDIVLLEQDNKKRINWPLARVSELLPGKDGIVRVVK
ncbi:unnamed protein product, partial [Allacma fusca]